MSERTAQRYIQITNQYGANATRVSNLSFKALALLSSETTPPEVRAEVNERAGRGENLRTRTNFALKRWLA